MRFYEVYCDVAPKRQALEEANAELAEAQEKLSRIKNKIAVSALEPVVPVGHCATHSLPVTFLFKAHRHSLAVVRNHQRWYHGACQGDCQGRLGRQALSLGELGTSPNLVFQELNANLSNLTSAFEKATAEKIKCQQEADATNRVISLANR